VVSDGLIVIGGLFKTLGTAAEKSEVPILRNYHIKPGTYCHIGVEFSTLNNSGRMHWIYAATSLQRKFSE